jgi:hypothetical protein
METRTLLAVIALMLAGIVTVLVARASAGSSNEDVFTNRALQLRHEAPKLALKGYAEAPVPPAAGGTAL